MQGSGSPEAEPVVVIGAGLSAGLIALALARRGLAVIQVAPPTAHLPGIASASGSAIGCTAPATSAQRSASGGGMAETLGGPSRGATDGGAAHLVATAAAQQGAVAVTADAPEMATGLSYGSLSLGSSGREWRRLERLHGPLGLTPCGLKLHDQNWLGRRWTRAASRVDALTLMAALPAALAAMGVRRLPALVQRLEAGSDACWHLHLRAGDSLPLTRGRGLQGGLASPPDDSILVAPQVVLAAGAGCLELWPPLAARLAISWAGVLALQSNPGANPWLEQVARGRLVLNRNEQRIALEDQADGLQRECWIVDPSAAPWGPNGVLVGQISLVQPLKDGYVAPDPGLMQKRLRQGLAAWDPHLADLEADYRQTPVAFGLKGQALVGPVPGAVGLWTFTGFRSPFSTAPEQAEQLAQALVASVVGERNLEQPD